MKLHFESDQLFQIDAINTAVDLSAGQPAGADEETILKNLQTIQKANDIEESKTLDVLHFSIDMEMGTGRTYVYLRTIRELHRQSDHEQTGRCRLLLDYRTRPALHWPSNAESKRKAEQVFWGLLG